MTSNFIDRAVDIVKLAENPKLTQQIFDEISSFSHDDFRHTSEYFEQGKWEEVKGKK